MAVKESAFRQAASKRSTEYLSACFRSPYSCGKNIVLHIWRQELNLQPDYLIQSVLLAEMFAVPFKILLVGSRHMFRNRTVLPLISQKTAMGCNPIVVVKNLNCFIHNPHINFAPYIFIRN